MEVVRGMVYYKQYKAIYDLFPYSTIQSPINENLLSTIQDKNTLYPVNTKAVTDLKTCFLWEAVDWNYPASLIFKFRVM